MTSLPIRIVQQHRIVLAFVGKLYNSSGSAADRVQALFRPEHRSAAELPKISHFVPPAGSSIGRGSDHQTKKTTLPENLTHLCSNIGTFGQGIEIPFVSEMA